MPTQAAIRPRILLYEPSASIGANVVEFLTQFLRQYFHFVEVFVCQLLPFGFSVVDEPLVLEDFDDAEGDRNNQRLQPPCFGKDGLFCKPGWL